jgi:pantoate kinase
MGNTSKNPQLQQCLNLSCDETKVAGFVSCDLWNNNNNKHAVVSKAIAMILQKAWGITSS